MEVEEVSAIQPRLAVIVAMTLLAAACMPSAAPTAAPTTAPSGGRQYLAGGTAIIRTSGDFGTFDPHKSTPGGREFLGLVYESLTALSWDGTVVPWLAKSWTFTPTQIVFTLRDDATCVDGTPITPTVVKNSLQRSVDLPAQYIKANWGPGPYTITADDTAGTVTVSVGTPYSLLEYGFGASGLNQTDIICPAGLQNPGLLETQTFGSGPYQIESAVHGDQTVMKLRKDWRWGPPGTDSSARGLPDTLIFKQVPNETTAANLLLTGGINIGSVTGSDRARLLADKTLAYLETPAIAGMTISYNETPGRPGASDRVREALSIAIDPRGWLQGANDGHGRIATAYPSPGQPCYEDMSSLIPAPSLAKAREILESDGYTLVDGKMTKNGQPLTINFVGTTQYNAGPDYIVSQWQQLGVTVISTITDFPNFAINVQKSNYDAGSVPLIGSVVPMDAATRMSGPPPPGGANFGNIQDPVMEQEKLAAYNSTGAESCQHWNAFWRQLLINHHVTLLTWDVTYTFAKNFVWDTGKPAIKGYLSQLSLRRVGE
jgi:peptide/nickel transport system substrate-binding protein